MMNALKGFYYATRYKNTRAYWEYGGCLKKIVKVYLNVRIKSLK